MPEGQATYLACETMKGSSAELCNAGAPQSVIAAAADIGYSLNTAHGSASLQQKLQSAIAAA